MPTMIQLIPDAETLLALEPEELGGALLEHLNGLDPGSKQQLNRRNFLNPGASQANHYPPPFRIRVLEAIAEAWAWLEQEGFLVPCENNERDWMRISRRGARYSTTAKVREYRQAALLPRDKLDRRTLEVVSGPFARGDYDTAVFAAFKEVEVEVRKVCAAPATKLGVDLMRDAFRAGSGSLSDPADPVAEQEALGHLFAGAIGVFKNPSSHRKAVSDPVAAAEMIAFASHLLRIVDDRANAKATATSPVP